MAQARKRLAVRENTTPGFFDPISLASEIHLELKPCANGVVRTEQNARMAFAKARSNRIARVRKVVTGAYLSAHPHLREKDLIQQNTKNHPVCMHACLLGNMVAAIYPSEGVFVRDEDAAWLVARAPELSRAVATPSVTDRIETTEEMVERGGGRGTSPSHRDDSGEPDSDTRSSDVCDLKSIHQSGSSEEPSDSRGHRQGPREDDDRRSNGDRIDTPVHHPRSGDRYCDPQLRSSGTANTDTIRRWWTDVSIDGVGNDFAQCPPWTISASTRLIKCDLPHVTISIDPLSGLVRATDITMMFDKRINLWLRIGLASNDDEGTRGLAYALAAELGTTPDKLVYVLGSGPHASTWINIQMIVSLASWCCPAFSLHATKLVLRYHSGELTTEDSQRARATLDASMRPDALPTPGAGEALAPAPVVPASSSAHRLVRTRARCQAVRGPDVVDVPIPRHLMTVTGIYIGAWGIVDEGGDTPAWWHLKVGKASEQPVTARIKSHYGERPHTFVLLYIAGCDGGACHIVEASLKHMASRVLGLPCVGNSDEEFKVPVPEFKESVKALIDDVERRHGDVLVCASDVPVDAELEKHRLDNEFKKYAFDQILRMGDAHARQRAIDAVLGSTRGSQARYARAR